MKCPKCDLEVKENFCAKCGHEVSSDYQSKSIAKFLIILSMCVLGFVALLIGTLVTSTGDGWANLIATLVTGLMITGIVFLTRSLLKDLDKPDKKSSDSYCMQCGVTFLDEEDLQFCTNCGSKNTDVKEDEREDFFTL